MTLSILTCFHLLFALIAIGSGAIVVVGLLTQELLEEWAVRFLRCSLATSVIGLLFQLYPFHHLTSIHRASMVSVYLSGAAILAWRKFHLSGTWNSIFVMGIFFVLYLDVLVVIVQVFNHIPSLTALAPTQSESPFVVTELVILMPFVIYGIVAAKKFHHDPPHSFLTIKSASRSGHCVSPDPPNAHKNNKYRF
jgi:hypothetical protein